MSPAPPGPSPADRPHRRRALGLAGLASLVAIGLAGVLFFGARDPGAGVADAGSADSADAVPASVDEDEAAPFQAAPSPPAPTPEPWRREVIPAFVVATGVAANVEPEAIEIAPAPCPGDGGCDAGSRRRAVVLVGYATKDGAARVARLDLGGATPSVEPIPLALRPEDSELARPAGAGTTRVFSRITPLSFATPEEREVRAMLDVHESTSEAWRARCGFSDGAEVVRLSGARAASDAGAASDAARDAGRVSDAGVSDAGPVSDSWGDCHSAPNDTHRLPTVWEERPVEADGGVRKPGLVVTSWRNLDAGAETHEVPRVPPARGRLRVVPSFDALVRGELVHLYDPGEPHRGDLLFRFPSTITGAVGYSDYLILSRAGTNDIEGIGPEGAVPGGKPVIQTLVATGLAGCAKRTRTVLDAAYAMLATREICDGEERVFLNSINRMEKFQTFEIEDDPIEVKLGHPTTTLRILRLEDSPRPGGGYHSAILVTFVTREGTGHTLRGLVFGR